MSEIYWTTLDGRKIPIRFMTTTHLGNAMSHQMRICGEIYQKEGRSMSLYCRLFGHKWNSWQNVEIKNMWCTLKRLHRKCRICKLIQERNPNESNVDDFPSCLPPTL